MNNEHAFEVSTNGSKLDTISVGSFSVARVRHAPSLKLRQHTHPHTCIVLPVAGAFMETAGSRSFVCEPGFGVIERPGQLHANEFDSRGSLNVVVRLRSPILESILERNVFSGECRVDDLARRLFRAFDEPVESHETERLLLAVLASGFGVRDPEQREPHWLNDAIRFIWENPRSSRTILKLARAMKLPPIRLARVFRKRFGIPLSAYILNVRDALAFSMLRETDVPLCELAIELGFSDQAHLTRTLRRYHSTTPAALRKSSHQD